MKTALIVMTILGCDDSATQCHYIDTVDSSWQSVALCDAQSETQMIRYQNSNYPVIAAVCETNSGQAGGGQTGGGQTGGGQQNADVEDDLSQPADNQANAATPPAAAAPEPPAPPTATQTAGIASRTLSMLKRNLPDPAAIGDTMAKPFRYAEDGYSWVVRKFSD